MLPYFQTNYITMANIVITGAAGNLGSTVVEKLLTEGHHLDVTIGPEHNPDAFIGNRDMHATKVDLTDEEAAQQYVQELAQKHDAIDAAILLVGGFAMGDIHKTDGAQLRKMYSLNFETAYFMARPLFEVFEKQGNGGRIFLVGTRPALEADAGKDLMAYALSKSLIFKLAEFLNAEGKDKNIVATVLVPSTIDTPVNREAMPDANFDDWVSPARIADSIAFMLTDTGKMMREPVLKIYNKA